MAEQKNESSCDIIAPAQGQQTVASNAYTAAVLLSQAETNNRPRDERTNRARNYAKEE
jgi:hypothetical protein